MKDLLRQSTVYYIAAPALLALWPLLLWLVYLPRAAETLRQDRSTYAEAHQFAQEILTLDPERLKYDQTSKSAGFDYSVAIDAATRKLAIPPTSYTISSKPIQRGNGQKTQDCQITLNEIDIARFAELVSNLQVTWGNLQCQKVTLTKREGLPDSWRIDLTLRYYY
jgi:hypothetical protein